MNWPSDGKPEIAPRVSAGRRRTAFPNWRMVLLSTLGWTAVGIVFALPRLGHASNWLAILKVSLADWWAWALLVPVITTIDLLLPIPHRRFGWRFLAHLGIGLLVCLVYSYFSTLLEVLVGEMDWPQLISAVPLRDALRGGFLWSLLVYLLIVGGWQAIQLNKRQLESQWQVERLERSYAEARLNALRMQLDPHFLFNALNTISALVGNQPALARSMIEQLGDLLRLSLQGGNRQEVKLTDELEFLGHYLAIQKTRFGDALNVVFDIQATAWDARVPSLILQPLLENAVRHGLSSRPEGGSVWVAARLGEGALHLTIEDDGVGLGAHWQEANSGLGLRITRERIMMLHPGTDAGLTIGPRAGGGTRVSLNIPFQDSMEGARVDYDTPGILE